MDVLRWLLNIGGSVHAQLCHWWNSRRIKKKKKRYIGTVAHKKTSRRLNSQKLVYGQVNLGNQSLNREVWRAFEDVDIGADFEDNVIEIRKKW